MPLRIFVARRCGKTAGMLAAFQGFAAPYGGKKTGDILWVLAGWGTSFLTMKMVYEELVRRVNQSNNADILASVSTISMF